MTVTTTTTHTTKEILDLVDQYLDALDRADAKHQAEYIERSIQKAVEAGKTLDEATERVRSYASERSYAYSAQMGRRFIKIIQTSIDRGAYADHRPMVHAFVEAETGLVFMPAGWSAPAKGARYDLTDEAERALLFANCGFSGGYLYAEQVAKAKATLRESE